MRETLHRLAAGLSPNAQIAAALVGKLANKTILATAAVGTTMTFTLTSASVNAPTQAADLTWSVPMSGFATGAGGLEASNAQAGWAISCSSVTAKARAKRGRAMSGAGVVTIVDLTLGSSTALCEGPHGSTMEIRIDTLPLRFDARAYDARTGVVTGRISGISATVENSHHDCVLTVAGPNGQLGELDATYNNTDGSITVEDQGHLRVASLGAGCGGLGLSVGDNMVVNGQFDLSPRGIITSP